MNPFTAADVSDEDCLAICNEGGWVLSWVQNNRVTIAACWNRCPRKSPWVSVKEELPKAGPSATEEIQCVVFVEPDYLVAHYDRHTRHWYRTSPNTGRYKIVDDVTHWMPIVPPEEKP